jgi:hypothetical protein
LPEVEVARLEQSIAERPDAQPVVAGTGGVDIYAKNEKSDLTPADKRELRTIVSLMEGTQ